LLPRLEAAVAHKRRPQSAGMGVSSAKILRSRGREGQFFVILCGRLLWTAPYEEWKFNIKISKQ